MFGMQALPAVLGPWFGSVIALYVGSPPYTFALPPIEVVKTMRPGPAFAMALSIAMAVPAAEPAAEVADRPLHTLPHTPSLDLTAMDDAPNYGNTGGSIGHELTHAFDDQGRKFDASGNLVDWWNIADAQKFKHGQQPSLPGVVNA
jgi:hypothetical protein